MIESAAETIVTFAAAIGLPVLAVTFYLKGAFVGKPIPASILLPGFILATKPTLPGAFGIAAVCSVASILGEATIYQGVKRQEIGFLNNIPYVSISESRIEWVSDRFEQYGGYSILVGSAIPGVRGTILIPAALASYPAHRAALASFTGTFAYHCLLVIGALGIAQFL